MSSAHVDAASPGASVELHEHAFARLVEEHQAAVFRYATAMTGSPEAAEDVLQEAFLAAYRARASYRGEATVRTWLLTIARHAAFRLGRRRAGEPERHDELSELGEAAGWGDPDTPETLALRREERQNIERALRSVSESEREVIVLRDLEELSTLETATILQISAAAVRSRLHRARLRFVAALRTGGDCHA